MLIIRPFKPEDIDRVYEIEAESFPDPYHPAFVMELYKLYGDTFFVAEYGGEIAGYIISRKIGFKGHIIAIAVAKKFRKLGIGRALMEAAERALALKGVTEIYLEVRASNLSAMEFYKKLGYFPANMVDNYYSDGEAAIIFKKFLV